MVVFAAFINDEGGVAAFTARALSCDCFHSKVVLLLAEVEQCFEMPMAVISLRLSPLLCNGKEKYKKEKESSLCSHGYRFSLPSAATVWYSHSDGT